MKKIHFVCYELKSNPAVYGAFRRLFEAFRNAGLDANFEGKNESGLFLNRFPFLSFRQSLTRGDVVVAPTFFSVIFVKVLLCFKGVRLVYWVQGDVPAEVRLKGGGNLKYMLARSLELLALNMSDGIIFVTQEMMNKYKKDILFSIKKVVLPCFSSLNHRSSICREENSYCYVGGMSKWQKVDWIIDFMLKEKNRVPSAKMYIATKDVAKAKELVSAKGGRDFIDIRKLESESEVEEFLSRMQYGLLLREDSPVNHVASPIKLAEYLSCGVCVIISSSLRAYANDLVEAKAGVIYAFGDLDSGQLTEMSSRNALSFWKQHFEQNSYSELIREFADELD